MPMTGPGASAAGSDQRGRRRHWSERRFSCDRIALRRARRHQVAAHWRKAKPGEREAYTWGEAIADWLTKQAHERRSIETIRLRWITDHLRDVPLAAITSNRVELLMEEKRAARIASRMRTHESESRHGRCHPRRSTTTSAKSPRSSITLMRSRGSIQCRSCASMRSVQRRSPGCHARSLPGCSTNCRCTWPRWRSSRSRRVCANRTCGGRSAFSEAASSSLGISVYRDRHRWSTGEDRSRLRLFDSRLIQTAGHHRLIRSITPVYAH